MATALTDTATRRFPLTGKQLMSIFGLFPLGAYVVAHLWTNLNSLSGADTFDTAVRSSRAHPAMIFLEVFGLGLPLLVHAIVGARIIFRMRPNNGAYNRFRNLKYLLQRLSGIGLLLFLGAHVFKARLQPALAGTVESWQGMHEALSEPLTFTVYLLGMIAIAYHLGNGVWSSSITLGLTTTQTGMKRMEWVSTAVFLLLLAMACLALYGFHPTLGA